MPRLTVHNAEIKTATVEVRTLTLSGKQVTLSVFKQIEEGGLVNKDGTLAGEPWGRVNYHPDKCADQRAHSHIVWQSGGELRRASVPKDLTHSEIFTVEPPSGRVFVAALVLAYATKDPSLDLSDRTLFDEGAFLRGAQISKRVGWFDRVGTLTVRYVADDDVDDLYDAWLDCYSSGRTTPYGYDRSGVLKTKCDAMSAKLRTWGEANSAEVGVHQLRERVAQEIEQLADNARKVTETVIELHKLPQLFIAV